MGMEVVLDDTILLGKLEDSHEGNDFVKQLNRIVNRPGLLVLLLILLMRCSFALLHRLPQRARRLLHDQPDVRGQTGGHQLQRAEGGGALERPGLRGPVGAERGVRARPGEHRLPLGDLPVGRPSPEGDHRPGPGRARHLVRVRAGAVDVGADHPGPDEHPRGRAQVPHRQEPQLQVGAVEEPGSAAAGEGDGGPRVQDSQLVPMIVHKNKLTQ